MRPQQTHFVLCFLAAASLPHIANGRAPAPNVDFNRDVRPILSQHCFKCHGFDPQARRSKLRLDRREAITAELPSGYTPVVAGDPQASELIRRIAATDPADRMPPADVAEPLSSDEIATLTAWMEGEHPGRNIGRWFHLTRPRCRPSSTPGGRDSRSIASSSADSRRNGSCPRPRPTVQRCFAA